jgi:hypothetical protein
MKTLTIYGDWQAMERIAELRPGQVIYPVQHTNIRTGHESISVDTRPGRTNLSGEERTEGWLGTTNDVAAHALGAFEVVSVRTRTLRDGRDRADIRVRS